MPIDVTIPDDTPMQPGQAFTKTWRLNNTGTCTWTKDYSVAQFSGEAMGAPASVSLPGKVAPGQSIDISVDMVAPVQPGTYQGNWKLRNASSVWFGWSRRHFSLLGAHRRRPGHGLRHAWGHATTGTPGPSPTGTPGTQVSGSTSLIPADQINLDTGQINDSSPTT